MLDLPKTSRLTRSCRSWLLGCVPVLALASGALGCERMDADEATADEALDSAEMTQAEGALIASGTEDDSASADATFTAAGLTALAVARGAARFQPAGCATVSADGTTLTYTLTECTGRFGLAHVTGTLVATLTDTSAGVDVSVTSTGLKVNRATLDLTATAVLTDVAGTRKLVVATHGAGVGPRGTSFTRDGSYTATHDPATACLSLDGQWALEGQGGRGRSTTVTGLQRCDGMCPAAGGQIVHTGVRGRTVTVTFDGSAQAEWSSSAGRTGTVELTCGG